MAKKAGTINEVFDVEAIQQQKKIAIDSLEEYAKKIQEISKFKVGSVGGNTKDVEQATFAAQRQAKVVKELTDEEIKLLQAKKSQKIEREREIKSTNELIGAYDRLKASWEKAKKELKDLAAAGDMTSEAYKKTLAEANKLDAKIKQIDKTVGEHQKNVGNYGSALDKVKGAWVQLAAAWTAGIAALSGVIALTKKAIQGAMEDERAERKLALALNGSAEAAQRLLRFKKELLETTLLDEEEIMQLINFGLAMERSELQTRNMVTAAIALSNATGGLIDVSTAMNQLNATYQGDLGRLKKYTGELTEVQLQNGAAIDIINEKYGKFISEGLNSTAGQAQQAKKYWDEFLDSVGQKLLNYFLPILIKYQAAHQLLFGKPEDSKSKQAQKQEDIAKATEAQATAVKKVTEPVKVQKIAVNELEKSWLRATEAFKKNELEKSWLRATEAFKKYADAAGIGIPSGPTESGPIESVPSLGSGTVSTGGSGISPQKISQSADMPGMLTGEELQAAEMAKWNTRLQIASEFTAQLTALSNTFYENELMHISEEQEALQSAKEKELEAAGNSKKKQDEINKKYRKKEEALEKEKKKALHDQAVMQKALAVVQAIVNTAVGVTAQLGIMGAGPVLAAIVAAMGAIEIATILAQSVPSYAKGRKGGPAEFARVSEQGQEGRLTKEGILYPLPAHESIVALNEGDSVLRHDEYMRAIQAATSPKYNATATMTGQELADYTGFMMVVDAIRNRPEKGVIMDANGIRQYIRNGANYYEYLNKEVRL